MKRLLVVLIIVGLTCPFALGQKKSQRPPVETPTVFRGDEASQRDPHSLADAKWFEVFKDERLQQLIREALSYNYDVREAIARIDEASAIVGVTRADQFPTITGGANLTTERLSRDGAVTLPEPFKRDRTFGSVLLNLLTFELDIWGRLRKATAAARADLMATEEIHKAVLTTLVSDVATSYFNLRELDFELEVARRTLISRQESLRIIKLRQERGV
jgi:multidrug efflux system outer membrane protein